jgi:hypothetical protein
VTGHRDGSVRTEPSPENQLLEIACDESGYEGERLVGGTTDVFAHGSVLLDEESAADCIQELRNRIRSPATEYKANHVLREKHRPVLLWLLGPSGPLHGNAHVQLVDKAFFLVSKVIDLLVEDVVNPGTGDQPAAILYREGRRSLDPGQWDAFLEAANKLMRSKDREEVGTSVDSFFQAVDGLAGSGGKADEVLELLSQGRPRAEAFRAQLLDNPEILPVLDPLMPAIVRAVDFWGEGWKPVAIVHDRQNTLPKERIAQLIAMASEPGHAAAGHALTSRLVSLTLLDSFSQPRIQLADFLAGVARKIASDQLHNRDDTELTALLRPYLDSHSIWADDRSWSRLSPSPGIQPN